MSCMAIYLVIITSGDQCSVITDIRELKLQIPMWFKIYIQQMLEKILFVWSFLEANVET